MDLYEGAIVDVVIMSVEQYGLVVDLDGKKGLVVCPNIYWDLDGAQQRMLAEFQAGQQLRVKILVVTAEQFSCSIKHVHPELDPWWDPTIYVVGAVWEGEVRLIFDFGAALIRLQNSAQVFVASLQAGTKLHDQVSVRITSVDVERQKLAGQQI